MPENSTLEESEITSSIDPANFLDDPRFQPKKSVVRFNEESQNVSVVKKTYTDPKTGKFVPGNPGGGKLPNRFDFFPLLVNALRKAHKDKGISLIAHAVERAYVNDAVMIALLKKILPDLTSETGLKGPQVVQIMMPHRGNITVSDGETQISVEQRELIPLGKLAQTGEVSECVPAGDRTTTGTPGAVFEQALPAHPTHQAPTSQPSASSHPVPAQAINASAPAVKSINA